VQIRSVARRGPDGAAVVGLLQPLLSTNAAAEPSGENRKKSLSSMPPGTLASTSAVQALPQLAEVGPTTMTPLPLRNQTCLPSGAK